MEKSSKRWWDFPAAVFLLFTVLFMAWRLVSTNWVDGLERVLTISMIGAALGLALGQSLFGRRGVILLSIGYMPAVFFWQWMGFIEFERGMPLLEKFAILFGRLWTGAGELLANRSVDDPLLFIAYLSVPYWLAGVYSGYQTVRHGNALASILPGAALMFLVYLNHYSATDYNWLFGAYFLAALLLISRLKYVADRRGWLKSRVQIPGVSGMDIGSISVVSAAFLIVLAWAIPYAPPFNAAAKEPWQKVSNTWFPEDRQKMFTSVTEERPPQPSTPPLQRELPLGTQAPQSAFVSLLVYAPGAAQDIPRLYWRGYIYDRFVDGRWESSAPESLAFTPASGEFDSPRWKARRNLNFTFDVYLQRQGVLFAPSEPVWVNQPAAILHAKTSAEDSPIDVMILQALPPLRAGDIYRVTALIADPTIKELREAGEDYPNWVMENYLQLPEDFSPPIQELAREITANHDNPYDRAAAVTEYLRREIEYAPAILLPEGTEDPLEYFLFEYKRGFCNYSASAQVLMLRSIGIPARLVVGFAQGEASMQNTRYTVRERDYHAWPEVYFPDYGWIEFEPTGNQDPIERPPEREERIIPPPDLPSPPSESSNIPGEGDPFPGSEEESVTSSRAWIIPLSIITGAALLTVTIFLLKRRFAPSLPFNRVLRAALERSGWETPAWLETWSMWTSLSPIERSFQSINASLRWMGRPQAVHTTPTERASLLKRLLPDAAPSIEVLLNEHQSALFSPRGGDAMLARRAALTILFKTAHASLKIIILGYN
jgi:transglutaminase-like putative cysteine protease